MSLQDVECHSACIVFAATGIVEENAAGFLCEGNDKFSRRAAAVRAGNDHGMGVCVANVRD